LMSFFNKVFASLGIGAAKVDTKLEKSSYHAGETMKGVVEIHGGNVEQHIDEIYLTIHTTYIRESDDKKWTDYATIEQIRITESFTIGPNEEKIIPFELQLPIDTPVTYGNTRVWVATGLDIKNAVDPKDQDYIEVKPNRLTDAVLSALTDLGFYLREVECKEAPHSLRKKYPFVQEFELIPVNGPFRGKLDELEVMFFHHSTSECEIILEVDRRARGLGGFLAEALNLDESLIRLTIQESDVPKLTNNFQEIITRYT
jgi:sporulation-control protein